MLSDKSTLKIKMSNEVIRTVETRSRSVLAIMLFLVCLAITTFGQGSDTPQTKHSENKADQNLKSLAHINPSTLAMEMSIPLINYPGRSGNSVPVSMSYSSKLWRMDSGYSYFYVIGPSGYRQYVTHLNPLYASGTAAGWSSSLAFPTIEEKLEVYNQLGRPFSFGGTLEWINGLYEGLFQEPENNGGSECANCTYQEGYCPASCPVCSGYCSGGCNQGDPFCDPTGGGGGTNPSPTPTPVPTPTPFGSTPTPTPVPTPIPTPTPGSGGGNLEPLVPTDTMRYVKRVNVRMGDGSVREFRKSDAVYGYCMNGSPNNATNCEPLTPDRWGKFLAVDGSGMILDRTMNGSTLYLPNGSKYVFPTTSSAGDGESVLYQATDFIDVNGNKTTFAETEVDDKTIHTVTDTMGRPIEDFLPQNLQGQEQVEGEQEISLKGLAEAPMTYKAKWLHLKPVTCTEEVTTNCGDKDGALENQEENLFYYTGNACFGNSYTNLGTYDPQTHQWTYDEHLFPSNGWGLRACNPFTGHNSSDITGVRFNPTVLASLELPNGQKYEFKYNQYGEISKIIYPTGSYETFKYKVIPTVNGYSEAAYDQTNRGVYERMVYDADHNPQQRWRYDATFTGTAPNLIYKVSTVAPKGDDPMGDGVITERYLYTDVRSHHLFGFEDPRVGMPQEEVTYDEYGVIRSRTLNDFVYKGPLSGGNANAKRDARIKRRATIVFEPGSDAALVSMSETEYDEGGSVDPEYFSHLNIKKKKGYHYALIPDKTTVDTEPLEWTTISGWFSSKLASVDEIDYEYDDNYKDRGILARPIEKRTVNPANENDVLSANQLVYDETNIYELLDPGSSSTWEDPGSTLRGNVTTTRTWIKGTTNWLEAHSQYDKFGNIRKEWDVSGESSKYIETQYSAEYAYAYPTKVITPAPNPDNTGHGTDDNSSSETTYDPTTGLVLTMKDDFGQMIRNEYNDPLLRLKKTWGDNFTAPVSEMDYDDEALTVKSRRQIDENNWAETTAYADSLGRNTKTVTKDSEGDVIIETSYDFLGRAHRVTNPYREGDVVYWSKTRFDQIGRAVEAHAPVPLANLANAPSLGTTTFAISDVTNYVGVAVTTTDSSKRRRRSITNALDQLLRLDEPTGMGGTEEADLGSLVSPHQSTLYTYDLYGNMVKASQGVQNRYFKYDGLGRLIRVNQPEQEYNPNLDLDDEYNTSDHWTTGYDYDSLDNIRRATDANGVNIIYEYDRAGRVTKRCYTKPNINTTATACNSIASGDISTTTPQVNLYYDGVGLDNLQSPNFAKGKLTKVENTVSQDRYTLFDNFGRIKATEQRTPLDGETIATATPRVSQFDYNLSGALVKETYPSGREVRVDLESDGDMMRIYGKANAAATEQTYANSFSYTSDGKIEKLKLGNGLWESARFNERLQMTELSLGHSENNGSLWKLNSEYGELVVNGGTVSVDAAKNTGNIARQTVNFDGLTNAFVQTYKYDPLQRLTEAKETKNSNQTWKQTFGYDRYGNRDAFTQVVGSQNLTINNLTLPEVDTNTNRFKVSPDQGYAYDKNGNMTSDPASGGRQFVFNAENKQTEVKDSGNNPVGRYWYDGNGKRVKKITNTEITIFVYSNGKLVAEYSTSTAPSSPTINYTVTDQLSSPRVITDKFGQVVSRRDFMPFGEELYADGSHRTTSGKYSQSNEDAVRKRFTGYEKDPETGLDFAEARYYNNQHARFTAVDPLLGSEMATDPQTLNRYVYVSNSPLVSTDPSGMQAGTQAKDDKQKPPPKKKKKVYVFVFLTKPEQTRRGTVTVGRNKRGRPVNRTVTFVAPPNFENLKKDAPRDTEVIVRGVDATLAEFQAALQDEDAAAVIFVGHGAGDLNAELQNTETGEVWNTMVAEMLVIDSKYEDPRKKEVYGDDSYVQVKAKMVAIIGCDSLRLLNLFPGAEGVLTMYGGTDGLIASSGSAHAAHAVANAVIKGKKPDQIVEQGNNAYRRTMGLKVRKIGNSEFTLKGESLDGDQILPPFKPEKSPKDP